MSQHAVSLDRLIGRLRELDANALVEVENFVEFLFHKKEKRNSTLLNMVQDRALPSVTLEQVREDLSTIQGSLSEVVNQLRQERG
jgi:hypothetical protein